MKTRQLSDAFVISFVMTLFVILLLALEAHGDVLTQKRQLLPKAVGGTTVQTASTTGNFVGVPNGYKNHAIRVVADNNSGTTPTLDVVVEDCWEATAASCETLATPTQCTTGSCWTNGEYNLQYGESRKVKPFIRAKTTLGGTNPNYDVKVELWQGK